MGVWRDLTREVPTRGKSTAVRPADTLPSPQLTTANAPIRLNSNCQKRTTQVEAYSSVAPNQPITQKEQDGRRKWIQLVLLEAIPCVRCRTQRATGTERLSSSKRVPLPPAESLWNRSC